MNSYVRQKIKVIAGILVLALCLALVVIGQRTVSYPSLGLILLGLGGMLVLLYLYNRSYTKAKNPYTENEHEKAEGK